MYGPFFNPYQSFFGSPMGGYGSPMAGYGSPYMPQYAPAYPGMFSGIGSLGGMMGFGGTPMFGFNQMQPFGQNAFFNPSMSQGIQSVENQQYRPSEPNNTPQTQPFQPTQLNSERFNQLMQRRGEALQQQRNAPTQQFTSSQMNEMMALRNKIGQENRAPTQEESSRLNQLGSAYMNSGPMQQARSMQEQIMRSGMFMNPMFSMFR